MEQRQRENNVVHRITKMESIFTRKIFLGNVKGQESAYLSQNLAFNISSKHLCRLLQKVTYNRISHTNS